MDAIRTGDEMKEKKRKPEWENAVIIDRKWVKDFCSGSPEFEEMWEE
jgi:hypothetical protein